MRKIALLLGFATVLATWAPPGLCNWVAVGAGQSELTFKIVESSDAGLCLQLSLAGFNSEPVRLSGRDFQRLSFDGSGTWGTLGQPELPVLRKLVRLPDRTGWNWKIVDADVVEISGYTPAPLQEEILETPDGTVEPEAIYNESSFDVDRWFPEHPVGLDRPIIMRDFRLGRLEFRPIQYNPARRLLRIYRSLTVEISFEGDGENVVSHPRAKTSRVFAELINRLVINPRQNLTDEEYELGGYLIITPSSLQSSVEANLAEWKREKGLPCTVYNTNQTGTSNWQIKNFIQDIYDTWPVPPDYLLLVGDNDYGMPTNTYSPSNNSSDLPYVLLEGSDYFPEMLVGRLSVDSGNELAVVCAKIRGYESNPYTADPAWFTRGLMVYDYGGSLSCQNVKQRCRDLMLDNGYSAVNEVTSPPYWNGYPYIDNYINAGVTFVNYRGYGSYSMWTPPSYYTSNVAGLYNGWKLPIVTSIVCGGGCFTASTDPCFGEGWLRYGSVNNPKGAVGFVGPTSLYTHTRWNNCIDGGIYQGIFEEGIGDFGSAVLRGLMELYYGMPNNQGSGSTNNSVECYFHIYTILGDPGLEMWTGVPASLTVTHEASLPHGVNAFALNVIHNGQPVEEALVCAYSSANDVQITGWTDESGDIIMDLANAPAGTYKVTVTGHNLDTYQGTLAITQEAVALGIETSLVDDDMIGESSGNGDGLFNPGETIELAVALKNYGTSQTATNVSGTISSADPYLTITESSLTGPNASPGALSLLNDDFNLVLSEEAPHSRIVQVSLTAASDQGSWENLINLPVVAPLAEAIEYTVQNGSGILNPGETADVTVTLQNSGGATLQSCSGTLTSPDNFLVVTDGSGTWGQISPGNMADNSSDPFTLQASANCPPGWAVPLELVVTSDIYCDTLTVNFVVGEISDDDPAGPDAYGYRCFDSRDVLYAQAPVYDWMEISSIPGQVTLNLPDYGNEDDCSVLQNLPFTFRYYGEDYNQITICSNGWISMGNNLYYISFRNWNIPGALGPPVMIAPFWDDLVLNNGSVHYFYDFLNYRVIIEWNNARTIDGWGYNYFQVILNDPAYYPTSTGDGEIIFQYYQFQNYDADENYCTIGIENWEQSDGVKVTYANHYTPGSALLTAGVALKFTTDIDYGVTTPDVDITLVPYNPPIQIPASGGSFDYNIAATNNEPSAQGVTIWCDVTLPNGNPYGPTLGPVTVTMGSGVTIDRDRSQSVPGGAPAGNYQYNAYIGSYPDVIWDSDSFNFAKLSSGDGEIIEEWFNWGEDFEETSGKGAACCAPTDYALLGAYPNPFNPQTTIGYQLPAVSHVILAVYDISGRLVTTLVDGFREAGVHEVTFDGSDFGSGIYFARLETAGVTTTKKIVLAK